MTPKRTQDFDLVVSTENNDYLAWQCLVLHHSCLTHLGQKPIFVVHGNGSPLAACYRILQEKGGIIQRLPNYKHSGAIEYAGRNIWATVGGVKSAADNIVLLDPDMVFLRHVDFAAIAAGLNGEAISYDRVRYMAVGDNNRAMLEEVSKTSWIDASLVHGFEIGGGVPYVIPAALRRRIAREWARLTEDCLMTNMKSHGVMNSEVWISVMWGFVLAALRNDIPLTLTDLCVSNSNGGDENLVLKSRQIVHYCYGDETFSKKNYSSEADSLTTVWKAFAPENTVNGAVTRAIRETAVFYGLAP